jgi:hypothetical protein
MTKKIEKALKAALLDNANMSYILYEDKLADSLDDWKASMLEDNDDYIFVITEKIDCVAMLLIDKLENVYINEQARRWLQVLWANGIYEKNIRQMIPVLAKELKGGNLSINGVRERETLAA